VTRIHRDSSRCPARAPAPPVCDTPVTRPPAARRDRANRRGDEKRRVGRTPKVMRLHRPSETWKRLVFVAHDVPWSLVASQVPTLLRQASTATWRLVARLPASDAASTLLSGGEAVTKSKCERRRSRQLLRRRRASFIPDTQLASSCC
jgi:hypothetical protein